MLDYTQQVTNYLRENFTPSDGDRANFKRTTSELMGWLFQVFPYGCISDYELNDIMLELGYTRQNYVVETYHEVKDGKQTYTVIEKQLGFGWCLMSGFDLQTEDFKPIDTKA